jgi:transcription elongation GreA/GreB family factor
VLLLVDRLREVDVIDDHPDSGLPARGPRSRSLARTQGDEDWILGEERRRLRAGVVSYRAAVGRALLGAREGESVTWTADGHEVTGTVRAVRLRLRPNLLLLTAFCD